MDGNDLGTVAELGVPVCLGTLKFQKVKYDSYFILL